ncbi:HET domain-containing protein [Fusarium sp. LHS14.1]|nr:HET domain-containing protein [Fusarium sp. LHS14.1]
MSAPDCSCSDANRQAETHLPPPTQVWTTSDLCAQCAAIDLNTFIESSQYSLFNQLRLRVSKASVCPFCRFLLAVVSSKYALTDFDADVELGFYVDNVDHSFWQLLTANNDTAIERCHVVGLDTKGSEAIRHKEGGDAFCPEFSLSSIYQGGPGDETPAFSLRQLRSASIDFEILRGWLGYCNHHHSQTCDLFPNYPKKVPGLKVIDCKTGSIIDAPDGCEFAALSYVWGESNARGMKKVACRESLPRDIPRTISDAMDAVLRLNLQYLWVDQYCIDQSNAEELQQQVSIMNMIYHLVSVTIVAASGKDASFGLPGVGLTPRDEQPAFNLNGHIWVSSFVDPKTKIKASTWFSRGWTYQEGLVSRRRLIFTEEQVYFECNNIQCWETLAYDFHQLRVEPEVCSFLLFKGGFSHYKVGGLDKFLQEYTKRDLSFQSDAINAIRGIFRMFSAMPSPVRHIWGHLESKFTRALCWYLGRPSRRREGFPSWSWAGWLGSLAAPYAWGSGYHIAIPANVKVWIQRNDGTYERLSESVIALINNLEDPNSMYRPILRVEALVGKVRIKHVAGGLYDMKTQFDATNPDPTYFVFCTDSSGSNYYTYYWSVVLTAQVTQDDELHRELCEEEVDCIELSSESEFVILLRKVGNVSERIGHVQRHWPHVSYDSEGFREDSQDHMIRWRESHDLFSYILSRKQLTLLG